MHNQAGCKASISSHTEICIGHGQQVAELLLVSLRYVEVQSGDSYHMKATMVRQSARSSYTCNEATVGASISRHDLSIEQVLLGTSHLFCILTVSLNTQLHICTHAAL